MINLLPPDIRQNILYARRNTQLLHWAMALLTGIVGVTAVVAFGYFYIDQNTRNVNSQVAQAHQELQSQKLEETQGRVEDISSSLKLVTQVLSKQILVSELLKQTGAVMPSGSSLAGLSINKLQGGIDLQAVSTDYQTATQVQVNLQDPKNKLFDKVDIINVSCSTQGSAQGYPCTGSYRARFVKDNPFAFLKTSGATK
jgi:cell division protein FtsL